MSNSLVLARLEDIYLEPDEDRRQIFCTCSICEKTSAKTTNITKFLANPFAKNA